MIRKIEKSVLVLVLLAFWVGCSGHLDKTPGRVATLSINPTGGKENTKLDISGSGFYAGEKILLLLNAEGMVRGKSIGPLTIGLAAEESGGVVTADGNGIFKLSRKIPVNIKPGVYTLEARGDKGSGASCSIEILSK